MNLKNGNIFTSTSVRNGPSSYEKGIYRAAVSQSLRNTVLEVKQPVPESNHSSHLSAYIKNERSYIPTRLHGVEWEK